MFSFLVVLGLALFRSHTHVMLCKSSHSLFHLFLLFSLQPKCTGKGVSVFQGVLDFIGCFDEPASFSQQCIFVSVS